MTLRTRLARLEVVKGGRVPTEHEMVDAARLLHRHFEVVGLAKIWPEWASEVDPNEVLLMRAAEAAGEIAAAEDVMERYERAKGYRRQSEDEIKAYIASLAEAAELAERTWGAGS